MYYFTNRLQRLKVNQCHLMVAQHGRQPPANCDAENGSDFPGEPFHTEVVELVKLLHTKMRNELENSPDRKHTMEF